MTWAWWATRTDEITQLYARLCGALASLLPSVRFDVVLLRGAPIELAYAVIAQGQVLYQRDAATRVEYETQKPQDYHEAILRMGELGVVPSDFARQLAPIAGFRNILVHAYLRVDWDEVYQHLQETDDLVRFTEFVRQWMNRQAC